MEFNHYSVLLNECIEGLQIKEDGIYVDATIGGAGHSAHILNKLTSGHLYGFDQDEKAIETSRQRLLTLSPQFCLIHANFVNLKQELNLRGIKKVNGILFDLGVSSWQLDEGERGFSYKYDAKLDMRMDVRQPFNAYTLVNTWEEKELADIIYKYSDERFSRQIARKIVLAREQKPITTTFELVDLIKAAIPGHLRRDEGHPAKRTFQAIRIAVNDELNVLKKALNDALELLDTNGRLAVISFHSLEDRIVKELFKEKTTEPAWKRGMPMVITNSSVEYHLITKHAIEPSFLEVKENRRSHSAKLRIIERK